MKPAPSRLLIRAAVLLVLTCTSVLSCTSDVADPRALPPHELTVEIETRGVELDGDGYLLSVGGAPGVRVSTQDTVTLVDLPAVEVHVLSLGDLAPNCAVDGEHPLAVSFQPGIVEGHASLAILCSFDAEITFTRLWDGREPNHALVSLHLPSLALEARVPEGDMAAWSRDGTRIAYVRTRCASVYDYPNCLVLGISVAQSDGSDRLDLTHGVDLNPSWSPTGDELVFERVDSEEEGERALYRVRTDGSEAAKKVPLPPAVLVAYEPDWSPNSNRLAFACYIDGPPQICALDLDGGQLEQLTRPDTEWHEQPAWSPDGTRIAFRAATPFAGPPYFTVVVVNADGTDLLRLHPGQSPSWSPDGGRLVFQGDIGPETGLKTMDADGNNVVVINRFTDAQPAWHR